MKKIFLLIFVTFCSLILYQIILGKNGIIEGYRIKKSIERNMLIYTFLKNKSENYKEYIKFLKTNPDALRSFAEELGFFDDEELKLIKIIDEMEHEDVATESSQFIDDEYLNNLKEKILNNNEYEKKIGIIRTWLSIFYYIFFGFFIFLIIFGIKRSED